MGEEKNILFILRLKRILYGLYNLFYFMYCHFIYNLLKITHLQKKNLCINSTVITEPIEVNFPERISQINVNKLLDTHTFAHTLAKETLKETLPFLCSEFSGAHFINPTCCRYILQNRHGHCKGTHFLIFLLKTLKDSDNLISLDTRSRIFGLRNEMESVPCLTEFTLRLCNVSFRRKLYEIQTGTNISFKMG